MLRANLTAQRLAEAGAPPLRAQRRARRLDPLALQLVPMRALVRSDFAGRFCTIRIGIHAVARPGLDGSSGAASAER